MKTVLSLVPRLRTCAVLATAISLNIHRSLPEETFDYWLTSASVCTKNLFGHRYTPTYIFSVTTKTSFFFFFWHLNRHDGLNAKPFDNLHIHVLKIKTSIETLNKVNTTYVLNSKSYYSCKPTYC